MNPWTSYDFSSEITVHPLDVDAVGQFNNSLAKASAETREFYQLSSTHTPLPFFGSLDAQVVILGANPGLKIGQTDLEESPQRRMLFDSARKHELTEKPFVFLRPEFEGTPGFDWWAMRTRALRNAIGDAAFHRSVFSAEIHPYKSVKYRALKNPLPTQHYTFEIVNRLVNAGAWVILMRAHKEWMAAVPRLVGYEKLITLNSKQNSFLTPGNMPPGRFDQLVEALSNSVPKQTCPICGNDVKFNARYPKCLCRQCASKTLDVDGNSVFFTNADINSDEIVCHRTDGQPGVIIAEEIRVWVDGFECEAAAARFGGVVIQRISEKP